MGRFDVLIGSILVFMTIVGSAWAGIFLLTAEPGPYLNRVNILFGKIGGLVLLSTSILLSCAIIYGYITK